MEIHDYSLYASPSRLKYRPLVAVALLFIAGIYAAAVGWMSHLIPTLLVATAGLALSILYRRNRSVGVLGLAVTFFALGGALWNAHHLEESGDSLSRLALTLPENARYTLEGKVTSADLLLPEDDYMQFRLQVDHVSFRDIDGDIDGGVVVRWSEPGVAPVVGDRVRITGPLESDLSRINPDTPSYEDYLRRHGIHAALRLYGPEAVEVVGRAHWAAPSAAAARFRNHLAHRLLRVVPESSAPFLLTVWLGDRRRVDEGQYDTFIASGTAHILAVSGVHVGIVYLSILTFLRLAFGNRWPRFQMLCVVGGVFVFAFVAGARIPTLRAASMIAIYVAAELLNREPDSPTALSIAAMVFLGYKPEYLFDVGFQLSFLSIASILLFSGPMATRLTWLPRWLQTALAVSLSVQLLSFPIAAGAFGVLPIASPFVNVLIIPLLFATLWLAFVTSVLTVVHIPADLLFGHAIAAPVRLIEWVTETVAGLPRLSYELPAPTSWAIAAYLVSIGCVYGLLVSPYRRRWLAGIAVSLLVTAVLWTPFSQPAEVVFLDVGHGDATFVRTPGASTILVDGGDAGEYSDMGRRVVAPFLRANHVRRLDYVVVTHSDRDHIGGIPYILEHFDVGTVCVGPTEATTELEESLRTLCQELGIPIRVLALGDSLEVEGATIDVLHPPSDSRETGNNSSIVLQVTWPDMNALLTGDIEQPAEAKLLSQDIGTDILKVPHHGSLTSSSRALLLETRPKWAVALTGRRRGGKSLRPEVVGRYAEYAIPLFRTDYDGGVRFRTHHGVPQVDTARDLRHYIHR